MADIYLIQDTHPLPEESQIVQALDSRWPIHRVKGVDALQEVTQDATESVVIFSVPPESTSLTIERINTFLPTAACINVIDPGCLNNTAGLDLGCHLLIRPLTVPDIQNRVAMALQLSEMNLLIEETAHLDEVTNLYNRQYFMRRLGEEISLARRHLTPLSVVLIGVGQYRLHLDSYGYEFINTLLLQVAAVTQKHIRHEDLVARMGDDEIGLLLPRSTEKGAKVLADRIINQLNTTIFKLDGYEEPIETHAGIASYPMPDDPKADADTIVRYARHALHNARCSEDLTVQLFSEIQPAI